MGCCSNKLGPGKSEEMNQIKEAIEKSQLKRITYLKKLLETLYGSQDIIDKPFTTLNNLSLNPLGFALVLGKSKSFQHLHGLGASFAALEELLAGQSSSVFEILCLNGFNDIFSYVLEIFDGIAVRKNLMTTEGVLTLDFERSVLYERKEKRFKYPLFLAALHGNLNIIDIAFRFQQQHKRLPSILNIHLVDQSTGENLALFACKKGEFLIVKYLHEVCKADFSLLNNKSENALIVTAFGSKKLRDDRFLNIFVYLIEEVRIEFESIYEDLLLILEDQRIIRYFYKVLLNHGIEPDKYEIERKYKPKPVICEKILEESKNNRNQSRVVLTSFSTESLGSAIKEENSRFTDYFSSFFNPETKNC